MRDCPQRFSTGHACREYLVQCRRPEGFVCPTFSRKGTWLNSRRYVFECQGCMRRIFSTTGTILHRPYLPLAEWFWAPPYQVHKRFPHIHRVFENLQTWLSGTYHGMALKHLPSYLDEFVFRFNQHKTPMAVWQTLLGILSQKPLLTLRELMEPESKKSAPIFFYGLSV